MANTTENAHKHTHTHGHVDAHTEEDALRRYAGHVPDSTDWLADCHSHGNDPVRSLIRGVWKVLTPTQPCSSRLQQQQQHSLLRRMASTASVSALLLTPDHGVASASGWKFVVYFKQNVLQLFLPFQFVLPVARLPSELCLCLSIIICFIRFIIFMHNL